MLSRPPLRAPLLALSALVACNGSGFLQPTSGAIEITTGYTIRVDDGNSVPIGTDTTVTLPAFTIGLHQVDLGGLAPGCSVQGDASRTVPVTQTDTARVTFAVACPA
jgi:hypothetical protein